MSQSHSQPPEHSSEHSTATRTVRVRYFALLREAAGQEQEVIETAADSVLDLYGILAAQHGFSLPPKHLRVAVNDTFCDWTALLKDGDRIVFIPPVAGG